MKNRKLLPLTILFPIAAFCVPILPLFGSSSTATSVKIIITEHSEATLGKEIINLVEDLVSEGISNRVRSRLLDNLKTALIEHRQFALDTEMSELAEDLVEENISQRIRIRLANDFIEKLCTKIQITDPTFDHYGLQPPPPQEEDDIEDHNVPLAFRLPPPPDQPRRGPQISRGNQILQGLTRSALADSTPPQPLPSNDYFQVVEPTHYRLPPPPAQSRRGPFISRGNHILQGPTRSVLGDSTPPLPDYFQVVEPPAFRLPPPPDQSRGGLLISRGNQTSQSSPASVLVDYAPQQPLLEQGSLDVGEPTQYRLPPASHRQSSGRNRSSITQYVWLTPTRRVPSGTSTAAFPEDATAVQPHARIPGTKATQNGIEHFSQTWHTYIHSLDQINKQLALYGYGPLERRIELISVERKKIINFSSYRTKIDEERVRLSYIESRDQKQEDKDNIYTIERKIEDIGSRAINYLADLHEICQLFENQIILRGSPQSILWGEPVITLITDKRAHLIDPKVIASSWVDLLIEKRKSIAEKLYLISFKQLLSHVAEINSLGIRRTDFERENSSVAALFDLYRQKLDLLIQITEFLKTYAMQKAFDRGYIAVATKVSEKYHELLNS